MYFNHTFEKEYIGLGAVLGLVQTLVAPGISSLLSFNNSAEYEGLAGIMGDRQHTLQWIKLRKILSFSFFLSYIYRKMYNIIRFDLYG